MIYFINTGKNICAVPIAMSLELHLYFIAQGVAQLVLQKCLQIW